MKITIKKTTKMVTIILFTIFTGTMAFAQPPRGGQRGGQQGSPTVPSVKQIKSMVSDLAKEISLTGEQEASVRKLYTEHFKEVKAKTSGNERPKREEMEALKSDLEKSVNTLLTADQRKAYAVYLKKQNSRQQRK